jgi:hypothetical protein
MFLGIASGVERRVERAAQRSCALEQLEMQIRASFERAMREHVGTSGYWREVSGLPFDQPRRPVPAGSPGVEHRREHPRQGLASLNSRAQARHQGGLHPGLTGSRGPAFRAIPGPSQGLSGAYLRGVGIMTHPTDTEVEARIASRVELSQVKIKRGPLRGPAPGRAVERLRPGSGLRPLQPGSQTSARPATPPPSAQDPAELVTGWDGTSSGHASSPKCRGRSRWVLAVLRA